MDNCVKSLNLGKATSPSMKNIWIQSLAITAFVFLLLWGANCAETMPPLMQWIHAQRAGGKLIVVGLFGGEITMPTPYIPIKAMTLQGSYTGSLTELKELIDLVRQAPLPLVPELLGRVETFANAPRPKFTTPIESCAPRSRLKLCCAMTMRVSISTCGSG